MNLVPTLERLVYDIQMHDYRLRQDAMDAQNARRDAWLEEAFRGSSAEQVSL